MLKEKQPRHNEEWVTYSNGRKILLDTIKTPYCSGDGKLLGILGISRDITERKEAENKVRESENRFNKLAEHGRAITWEVNANGLYTCISHVCLSVLGYEPYELIGKKHFYDLHPEQGRKEFKSAVFEAFARKEIFRDFENAIESKDKKIIWVLTNAMPMLDDNGQLTGYRGTDTDITVRKQMDEELKQVSARLALATRAGGVGIWDYDIANNILMWDNQMIALYGLDKKNFSGAYEAWLSGVHPDDLVRGDQEIQMAISGKKEFNTEFRVLWPDGTVRYIRAIAIVQRDDSGKALRMIGTNWDITAQKKSEASLLKAKAEAETANKSKSTFLSNMSHEIRTPLNAIIGFSQLMNREKSLTDSQQEYATSINRAGEHLLKLINDILELSKIEAGRVELKPADFDLHAVLNEVQMMFREQAQSKQLQLILEASGDLPHHVMADSHKLRQILINLIGNAIKFTDQGSIVVRARVDKDNDDTSRLIVEIEDSGPGMSEDELGKLFKQFEQTTAGIKNNSGTGLGLALSRELAVLMGGNITVASEEGKGSVFTFHVALKEGKSEITEVALAKRVISIDNPQEAYRVLVVDDNEENWKLAVNFLKMVGFETNEAVNGADAITKFEQWNPHVILMDLRMPVMDGYETTRRIKSTEKGRQTPVIAVTASSLEDEKQETIALDIQGFVRKPFRESELFETIGKVLGIEYTYEEEKPTDAPSRYLNNEGLVEEDIAKLPDVLVIQMIHAVETADFHLLTEHIMSFENEYPELSRHLMAKATDYNYVYLLQVLSIKGS